jgi:hypothetical protein
VTLRSASVERSRRAAGSELVREHLLRIDSDRPKRIDDYIDYFGNDGARPTRLTARRADDRP